MITYEQLTARNFGVYNREQQKSIRNAKIAIIGFGCVGELAADELARIGVCDLTFIDDDIFEIINTNRQIYSTIETIGMKKVTAGALKLKDVNPFVKITPIDARFSRENAEELLLNHGKSKFDIIIQGMDRIESRIDLHRVCANHKIPVVTMTGQPPYRAIVSTFTNNSPSYEHFFGLPTSNLLGRNLDEMIQKCKMERAIYASEHGASKDWFDSYKHKQAGWAVTPERVYLTGTLQVHEALRYITGRKLLAEAPKAIIIDLNNPPNIVSIKIPPNGQHWDYRMF